MDDSGRREAQETTADQPIKLRFDFDHATTSPSTALIEALAAAKNTDAIALLEEENISVGDSIDLDALDRLMGNGHAKDVESITVSIEGYAVQISDGEVVVQSAVSDA